MITTTFLISSARPPRPSCVLHRVRPSVGAYKAPDADADAPYANETGETIGTEKAFSQGLVERGFERKKSHGKRRFLGIAPKLTYERND
jgi:hypothetical protein